jgi:hypothetical protein
MTDQGDRQRVARELRIKAALARRAANIPTSGSWRVDRLLVVLAECLELEAVVLEQEVAVGAERERVQT